MEFKLHAAVRHDEESGLFVSWCPALNIFSQGTSFPQACAAIKSGVTMWLEHCYSKGILNQALAERGFVAEDTDGPDAEGEFVNVEEDAKFPNSFDFSVPFHLIADMIQRKESTPCPS